ncbi:hypothetical protein VTK73DRAFT_4141 [Phialemonium thermophilum]|uniref:Uncharacterized protein n=1 Tax=Phialemonium thermophilum TaxID=223376 RepID=A0ABR3VCX2_9PEZI
MACLVCLLSDLQESTRTHRRRWVGARRCGELGLLRLNAWQPDTGVVPTIGDRPRSESNVLVFFYLLFLCYFYCYFFFYPPVSPAYTGGTRCMDSMGAINWPWSSQKVILQFIFGSDVGSCTSLSSGTTRQENTRAKRADVELYPSPATLP